ncbi:MAG: glycoside hydrolase family 3 N-terminal domain-containing protein, partial [Sphingomonadales bacterium]
AMTAHVTYAAIDPDNPASTSEVIISEIIRGALGFRGLLISDDISMGALEGDFAERANRVLGAGVDLVLHCNGEMAEMEEVARSVEPLAPAVAADLDLLLGEAETRRRQMPLNLAQLEDEAWDGKA